MVIVTEHARTPSDDDDDVDDNDEADVDDNVDDYEAGDIYHSLIIIREVSIITLSIFNALQG